ncbi:MAG: glutamate--tRNA ligase [Alphaproteobacteria bacterium]
MTIVTRFAPSPTGFLHIGGARTALFNWLLAKHHGGKYLLRIEDTDKARSTQEAIDAIIDGLDWLGLKPDGDIVFQSRNAERHAAVAKDLLEQGKAYKCYCSSEELQEMRDTAKTEGRPIRYDGRWRDRDPSEAPEGIDPVVRIKMPQSGETVIDDLVQGPVTIKNEQLDDFILLRSDGSPTYMHSVVVDDHDMGITHVVRGDDHLTNAFRQYHVFKACGWDVPDFAHIPLIHGPDGAKLSKRHGALSVHTYRDELGYLPEALCNYLLRLGWAHGDDEIIDRDQSIEWFDLGAVGRSPARFDFAKLDNLNGHYIRGADDKRLADLVCTRLGLSPDSEAARRIAEGMPGLKERAKTIVELSDNAAFYAERPVYPLTIPKAAKLLNEEGQERLKAVRDRLENAKTWQADALEEDLRTLSESLDVGLGKLAQPLRAALSGSNASPSLFEVMVVFGPEETLARIDAALAAGPSESWS